MGNETGSSWSPHHSLMLHSPNHDSSNPQSLIGQSFTNSTSADAVATNLASFVEGSPSYAFTGVAHSQNGQFNQPRGWFYCLPRFRQTFTPGLICSVPKEKIPLPASNPSNGDNTQKKFLIFDQSGDQTTLMVNSGIGTPFQCISSWNCAVKADLRPSGATWKNENDDNGSDSPTQMHEDSDELDALLYSSSDDGEVDSDYSEDDEVTSTAHSPNEVATRKRKLVDSNGDDDTASSGNSVTRCIKQSNGDNCYAQSSSKSNSKRIKKEKIREAVSVLQDMIPGGKGKDAVVVLDEAIHYLKSLKVKAKALALWD